MTRKLLFFIFFAVNVGFTQQPEFRQSFSRLGYYGNLVLNPGLVASYEYTFADGTKNKTRIKRLRQVSNYKFNRFSVAPSVGFYADPGSNFNAFGTISFLYRRINQKGRTLAVGPGIGYVGSFVRNVYSFTQNTVTESGIQAIAYVAPAFRIETGRFKSKNNKPGGWYAALSTNFLLEYNAAILPTAAVEFGKNF